MSLKVNVDKNDLPIAAFNFDRKRNTYHCSYQALPHQKIFHESRAEQLLLGGAAGPGKSIALRFDCYFFCLSSPGLKAYLFRRTLGELRSNHIDNVKAEIPKEIGEFNASSNTLRFKNGSILYFSYCADDLDVHNYQGAEIHLLAIDEATHFSEYQHNYLRGRVRLGSFEPSEQDKPFLPRIIYGSNPGNIGHNYLKRIFVDQCEEPNKIFYDKYSELPERSDGKGNILPPQRGMSTIYIPCNFFSNPYINASYERQFAGLPPEQIKSLVHGDWDASVGQAFFNLSREKHMVPDFFDSPGFRKQFGHFTIMMGYDHGSTTPGVCLWGLIPDQDLEIMWKDKEIIIPAESIVLFKEWFIAAKNTDNTG
jgi:Terminase large subunit, T4likevirus-type, N-terminal